MPTAAIRGRSFSPPFAKSSGKSTWKSSSVPIQQRALRSCPSDGSSSAPSPGSIAVAAWPRIGSASTERPWRSCALPQSASCSESSVKKQHDPGQTLRRVYQFAHDGCWEFKYALYSTTRKHKNRFRSCNSLPRIQADSLYRLRIHEYRVTFWRSQLYEFHDRSPPYMQLPAVLHSLWARR